MKKYKILSALTLGKILFCLKSFAQGCVAIRQFSGLENSVGQGNMLQKGEWSEIRSVDRTSWF